MLTSKVLHLASFSGNIGDNANHMGFRDWFQKTLDANVEWTDLEIREFYWKERHWDQQFVELVNAHDLLIIGGGNYFELWVESSPTGTSIAIPPEMFDKIEVPIFFNALGVDPGQGVPTNTLSRFSNFLDKILTNDRMLVSVRNDGAQDTIRKYLGGDYSAAVFRIPDGGFFVPKPEPAEKANAVVRIGINLASDMPEIRFRDFGSRGVEAFAIEISDAIMGLARKLPESEFVLIPHIFRDIDIISRVLHNLDDRLRRTRVSVFSYGSGEGSAKAALSVYRSCDLVLAMRFHANVCPLGMGVQTLGLACYPQISNLYAELNQSFRAVDVSRPGFSDALISLASRLILEPESFPASAIDTIDSVAKMRQEFEPHLRTWLELNSINI